MQKHCLYTGTLKEITDPVQSYADMYMLRTPEEIPPTQFHILSSIFVSIPMVYQTMISVTVLVARQEGAVALLTLNMYELETTKLPSLLPPLTA